LSVRREASPIRRPAIKPSIMGRLSVLNADAKRQRHGDDEVGGHIGSGGRSKKQTQKPNAQRFQRGLA
jgi:hypothetical protein